MRSQAVLALAALLAISSSVRAEQSITDAVTVQAGTAAPSACGFNTGKDATNLPANIWTLIMFDDAGEPCETHAYQLQGTCSANTWNWVVDGHATFEPAPGQRQVKVRMQVWTGGGGGACYGGSSEPIYCDNPAYKSLKADETVGSNTPGVQAVAPFSVLNYLNPPYCSTPGDENYQGIWVFAMPLGAPATCTSVNYHDLGAN